MAAQHQHAHGDNVRASPGLNSLLQQSPTMHPLEGWLVTQVYPSWPGTKAGCQPSFVAASTVVKTHFQIHFIPDVLKVLHILSLRGLLHGAVHFIHLLFFLVTDDQVLLPCEGDYFLNVFQQEGETDSALKRWAEHLCWEQQQPPEHLSLQRFAVARISAQGFYSSSSILTTASALVLLLLH